VETAVEIPACLALTACPNCGYSLEGLPDRGVCPECGREYAPGEIILYGYGSGPYENVMTARPTRLWRIWIGAVLGMSVTWFMIYRSLRWYGIVLLAAVGLIPMVYLYWRRQNVTHPAPVQVRIGPAGWVQYNDLAPPSPFDTLLRSNFAYLILLVLFFAPGLVWKRTPVFFMVIIALAVGISLLKTVNRVRRYRQAVRNAPENAIADVNCYAVATTPWKKVFDFEVVRYEGKMPRLVVKTSWAKDAIPVVDVDLDCTTEQAKALVEAVKPWWQKSREGGDGGIA
jgi:hypothetical protein